MTHDDGRSPLRLKVDLRELAFALAERLDEHKHCLDRETGEVVLVSDEALGEIESLAIALDPADDAQLAAAIAARDEPAWQIEELLLALAVTSGWGDRFVEIAPTPSHIAYQDMEAFIETVGDERLHRRLARAIEGRGAFRRFKDTLDDDPAERERWFEYRDACERARAIAWLHDEGIEPILEEAP